MSEVSAVSAAASTTPARASAPVDGAAFWAMIQANSRVTPDVPTAPPPNTVAQQQTIVSMIESMMQTELTSMTQASQQAAQAKAMQSGDWGSFFSNVVDRPLNPEADPAYASILNLGQTNASQPQPSPQQAIEEQMMNLLSEM
ncbi:MAG TPA: hypothetical protein V6D47_08860 [Oscillatoriaceae cyanobacterium]